jgi:hypothetical protein
MRKTKVFLFATRPLRCIGSVTVTAWQTALSDRSGDLIRAAKALGFDAGGKVPIVAMGDSLEGVLKEHSFLRWGMERRSPRRAPAERAAIESAIRTAVERAPGATLKEILAAASAEEDPTLNRQVRNELQRLRKLGWVRSEEGPGRRLGRWRKGPRFGDWGRRR